MIHRGASTLGCRETRPPPGTFVDGEFSSVHGKLAYKLYTPVGSSRRRLPLVVMLHGCIQTAASFATSTGMNKLADDLGFLVLYPQQSTAANINRCWNWHRPSEQRRGSGEPAKIAELTRNTIDVCNADLTRVYIAGMSAGGAEAAIVAAAYPELYVALGVHSGISHGNIRTLQGAMTAMRNGSNGVADHQKALPLPTIVFHGDQDRVVNPSNTDGFLVHPSNFTPAPITGRAEKGRSPGGRDFTRTVYSHRKGKILLEKWIVHGSGHAWSGGDRAGSQIDPAGPDASREMIRFFLSYKRPVPGLSQIGAHLRGYADEEDRADLDQRG